MKSHIIFKCYMGSQADEKVSTFEEQWYRIIVHMACDAVSREGANDRIVFRLEDHMEEIEQEIAEMLDPEGFEEAKKNGEELLLY